MPPSLQSGTLPRVVLPVTVLKTQRRYPHNPSEKSLLIKLYANRTSIKAGIATESQRLLHLLLCPSPNQQCLMTSNDAGGSRPFSMCVCVCVLSMPGVSRRPKEGEKHLREVDVPKVCPLRVSRTKLTRTPRPFLDSSTSTCVSWSNEIGYATSPSVK